MNIWSGFTSWKWRSNSSWLGHRRLILMNELDKLDFTLSMVGLSLFILNFVYFYLFVWVVRGKGLETPQVVYVAGLIAGKQPKLNTSWWHRQYSCETDAQSRSYSQNGNSVEPILSICLQESFIRSYINDRIPDYQADNGSSGKCSSATEEEEQSGLGSNYKLTTRSVTKTFNQESSSKTSCVRNIMPKRSSVTEGWSNERGISLWNRARWFRL